MASEAQLRLRRSKDSERALGKWLILNNGPDPKFLPGNGIVTTTGRVGHVTGLQFDIWSRTYAAENKQIKVWSGLWGFWKKIVDKANQNSKQPLLVIDPTNIDRKVNGVYVPKLHVISEERHAELLQIERLRDEMEKMGPEPKFRPYTKEEQLGRSRTNKSKARA